MGKRLLAALCTAILLMTSPGVSVLADESISDEYVSEQVEEITDVSKQGEDAPNIVESQEDPLDISEPKEVMEEISVPEEGAEEIEVEDTSLADDAETEIPEEAVGEGEEQVFTVGDGVTARFVKEGDKNVLYFDSRGGTLWNNWKSMLGSDEMTIFRNARSIQIIKFTEGSTKMYLPENSSNLFDGYEDIDGLDHTPRLSSVKQIQLDKVDTSKVKDMSCMFSGCSSLTQLDVSGFTTSNVTNIGGMFSGCSSLTQLDVSGFTTSNVTNIGGMFLGCSSLTNVDLSNFITSNVTDMSDMFSGCSNLTNVDLSSFNTSKVSDVGYMFSNCCSLTNLDLSNFDLSNTSFNYSNYYDNNMWMLKDCNKLSWFRTPTNASLYLPVRMYDELYHLYDDELVQPMVSVLAESHILIAAPRSGGMFSAGDGVIGRTVSEGGEKILYL